MVAPVDSSPCIDEPLQARAKREAFAAFRDSIPQSLCHLVEAFGSHQWLLLQLVNASAPGRELAESNPPLAYMLANSHEFRRTQPDVAAIQARIHAHQRQKVICAWLGFPDTLSTVRLLKKLSLDAVSPSILRRLRLVLKDNAVEAKSLRHRQVIHAGVLDFLLCPRLRALATSSLMDELENSADRAATRGAADQLLHALEILDEIRSRRSIRAFHSIRRIHEFVESVDQEYMDYLRSAEVQRVARLEAAERAERERAEARERARSRRPRIHPNNVEWPQPPLLGTDQIAPITSYAMLCEESDLQSNCIRSYWRSIVDKGQNIYAYRLLEPERATFTIVRMSSSVWRLSELKQAGNRKVSARSRRVVEQWLYSHSLSAARSY
ncbi:MAG: hypothetical protein O2901_12430 [Verrucomicrobia bacterium]|nr:hypothetical protein [Verrucomicrobiota bacterium]